MSTFAVVVIVLFAACIVCGLVFGISDFKQTVVGSLLNMRTTDLGREKYTRSVIERKGFKNKAEAIMREAYADITRNVGKYTSGEKNRILNKAYRRALELSSEYIDEREAAYVQQQPSYAVDGLSNLYKKFYGDAFDPKDKL